MPSSGETNAIVPGSAADSGVVTDIIFSLRGSSVMPGYAAPLWQALRANLPWLAAEPTAAIHPLARTGRGQGALFIGRHTRLILRLPERRIADAYALCGRMLEIGAGATLEVGVASLRSLRPSPVQYSPFVTLGVAAEADFLVAAERQLSDLGIACHLVCGKAQTAPGGEDEEALSGFSLMLHGLTLENSLRIQHAGLGDGRMLGCGIFVPHKTVAAVGAN
ncbi:MAG: type I-MYXAN CRISPR-associated protein Cas6/Cmx6 [Betaproteobacteria bacterium]|nr:type I-MYXAN CRISPR-associated protein Cas6/Cmx6 [Betaproteobacteria bacterium]